MLTAQAWYNGDDLLHDIGTAASVQTLLDRADRSNYRAVSITSPRSRMIYRKIGADWVMTYSGWS